MAGGMGRDRLRVLAFTLAYVVLGGVSAFALDWFELRTGGGRVGLDLRHASACVESRCFSVELAAVRGIGAYPYGAWLAFWGTVVLSLLVGFQAVTRIFSGFAHPKLSRMGVVAAMAMAAIAAATGFVLTPESGPLADVVGIGFDRTVAPVLMIIAHVAGIFALHSAAHDASADDVGEYRPVVLARPPADRPIPGAAVSAAVPRAVAMRAAGSPRPAPFGAASPGALPAFPPHLRKRLSFVTLSAELTRAGIDARREDGRSVLVMWRDVAAVIARRLPPELDAEPFVDVVSTPGSSLRVLPWTRLSGEPLPGTGDDRARALVTFIASHCPGAHLDPATRAFVDDRAEPAPLESVVELAAHDARL
jgi:hypothetical protein